MSNNDDAVTKADDDFAMTVDTEFETFTSFSFVKEELESIPVSKDDKFDDLTEVNIDGRVDATEEEGMLDDKENVKEVGAGLVKDIDPKPND